MFCEAPSSFEILTRALAGSSSSLGTFLMPPKIARNKHDSNELTFLDF